jgi:uncharacterized membrane protein
MNKFVLFALLYLFMDLLWITGNRAFYNPRISRIQQGKPVSFRPTAAVVAYVLLLLTLFFVCMPLSRHYQGQFPPWVVFGVVGLCVYGVFNSTNYAIFADYPLDMALIDTLWGFTVFALFGYFFSREALVR